MRLLSGLSVLGFIGMVAACQAASDPEAKPDFDGGASSSGGGGASSSSGGGSSSGGSSSSSGSSGSGTTDGGDASADGGPSACGSQWNGSYTLPANEICSIDGFCYRQQVRFESEIRWVWGASATDFWMASPTTVIHSLNGAMSGLTGLPDGPGPIHGVSSSDVWIGALHWDGTSLGKSPTPPPGKPWFAASNDGWAIHGTKMAHWDGATWTDVSTPAVLPIVDVYGFASNDVYAVAGPAFIHWDGTQWAAASPALPAGADARSVWGAATNDFWVGGVGAIYHLVDGAVTTLTTSGTITSISGISTTNVLFQGGPNNSYPHWAGAWDFKSNGFNGPSLECVTRTIFMLADGNVVFGYDGQSRSPGYLNCSAGRTTTPAWKGVEYLGNWDGSPVQPIRTYGTDAIPMADGTFIKRGAKATVERGTFRDGFVSLGRWGVTDADISVAVSGTKAADLWVSGMYANTTGIASHRDATGWTWATVPGQPMSAIHATSPTSAWVGTKDGAAYFDGVAWTAKATGLGYSNRIWGNGPNEAWMGSIQYGTSGSVAHWDGTSWVTVKLADGVAGIGTGPSGKVRVVGYRGSIFDWNGTAFVTTVGPTFVPRTPPTILKMSGMAFAGPDEVWAVDGDGREPRVAHWKNGCWTFLNSGLTTGGAGITLGIEAANGRVLVGALAETP